MSKLALLGGSPIFDKKLEWQSFWPPVDAVTAKNLLDVYNSRKWTAFDETEPAFAQSFATYQGAKYGIFTVNGTITLHCALGAYGIGPGDEVIVTPLTWYATAMAVRHVGAKPIFVDIEPDTLCADPEKVEAAVTERTKAIIPVHAYGSMADMDRIMAIAKRHNLRVIEDCAHMHGGIWDGKGVGTIGDVGSFSFQNSKTMSSGEGGICITNNAEIADRIFRMKHIGYGMGEMPRHAKIGPPQDLMCYNFRATAFHVAILQQQLQLLDSRLDRYTKAVQYLEGRLGESTRIRFQKPGRKATRQGRFGWVTILDDPAYTDLPIEILHKAIEAEGLPMFRAEGPIYRYILFNLPQDHYRIDKPCSVTENTCARSLWLLHPYLALESSEVERIADAIEKVTVNVDDLRRYSKEVQ
jgi:dTDP-4-amino-4,6-dideoxygalactose transaminase